MPFGDVTLSAAAVKKLLCAASPEAALLYLYIESGGLPGKASETLGFSQQQLSFAVTTLRQLGLLSDQTPKRVAPSDEPLMTERDVAQACQTPEFTVIVGDVQRRFGRILTTEELKTLLYIYRYLGFSAEMISTLVNYCMTRSREQSHRPASMRAVEKEAFAWSDEGVETIEQAVGYIQQKLRQKTRAAEVCRILQIGSRNLTAAEKKYLEQWFSWGFGGDAIAKAYEITCVNVGGLNWKYLNGILQSWQQKGLLTVDEIEKQDQKPSGKKTAGQPQWRLTDYERESIEQMMRQPLEEE